MVDTQDQVQSGFKNAKTVLKLLLDNGYEAMFAGGCVRDRLLGLTPTDFDIATTALPDEVIKLTRARGWKAIPTGIQHGTVTVVNDNGSWEVTTLRRDVQTDGRHAVVEFSGTSFVDDAKRRDFTINAMFEDVNENIHDFFGGQEDLKKKLIRFVGDPTARIQEDYLRILRFFRFWAKLDFLPDPDSLKATIQLKEGLSKISVERINAEFLEILAAKNPVKVLQTMSDNVLLNLISAGFREIDKKSMGELEKVYQISTPDHRMWCGLLFLLGLPQKTDITRSHLEKFARHLKWSDSDQKTLIGLVIQWNELRKIGGSISGDMDFIDETLRFYPHMDLANFFAPIWRIFAEIGSDRKRLSLLTGLLELEEKKGHLRKSQMPVTGDDVLSIRPDLHQGEIGKALICLKTEYREGFWSTREEGLNRLKILKSKPEN